MSYRYDKEKKRAQRTYLVGSVLLVLVFFTPFLVTVYDISERFIASSWQRIQENTEVRKGFLAYVGNKQSLIQENKLLQEKIAILEVDVLRTRYLESVLDSYELIKQEYQEQAGVITGEIIARYPQVARDTIVINKGSDDGVQVGDRIVSLGNLAIGNVSEVFDHSSRVQLYTKNGVTTQASLYGSGEGINLIGAGSMYRASFPRESEVLVGDIVYTQDTPGMVLGVVREIVFDPRDPVKQVYLSLPVNSMTIQTIAILK